jgi:hypothetical protein
MALFEQDLTFIRDLLPGPVFLIFLIFHLDIFSSSSIVNTPSPYYINYKIMLRATSNSLIKANSWKNTAIYTSVKNYTNANATPVTTENKEKPSLSQRLGGTGRGKIMEGSSDPFASFLANAKKPRNNSNRNGNFTPRTRKPQQQQSEGQFADATEQPKQQRPRNDNNNKNRNNRPNNIKQNEKQSADGTAAIKNNNNNNRRSNKNNNNRNNAQNVGKKLNLRRSQQPQEVRTRRATTFIDKDIDWASFDTTTLSTEASAAETVVEATEQDSDELVLKDIQGDYDRYLLAGSDMKWPQMIQGATLSTLVGSNPTFDLQQKTAFLAALSNATNGNTASARK